MTSLTDTGFIRSRLDERYAELVASMQGIFGLDIDLDPDTVDGQTLGIFAEAIANLDMLAEDLYHCFNPQTATGVALSRLVQINGIRRIAGRASTVTLRCIGTTGTEIPKNALVRSALSNETFATTERAEIGPDGFVDIPAVASQSIQGEVYETFGPITVPTGTLTKIDTPIYGWHSVSNVEDAIPGRYEETDEQLRARRRLSTNTPGQCILDALYGALANIPSVIQVKTYENFTNSTDALGLPPHSLYAIVEGGTAQEICQTIWDNKTAGTTTHGELVGYVQDGSGKLQTIHYARPTKVPVYITIHISSRIGFPTDGADRMKAALVRWCLDNQIIGEELIRTRLYDPINSVPEHSVTNLFIGLTANPTEESNITIAFDSLIEFDTSRIEVIVT